MVYLEYDILALLNTLLLIIFCTLTNSQLDVTCNSITEEGRELFPMSQMTYVRSHEGKSFAFRRMWIMLQRNYCYWQRLHCNLVENNESPQLEFLQKWEPTQNLKPFKILSQKKTLKFYFFIKQNADMYYEILQVQFRISKLSCNKLHQSEWGLKLLQKHDVDIRVMSYSKTSFTP